MTHHNPAIEQAVKALEQCKACIDVMYQLLIEELGNNQTLSKLAQSADDNCEQALTSLRAMQQEPVSKTDEELARELLNRVVDTVLIKDAKTGMKLVLQAFAAIRKQALDEAVAAMNVTADDIRLAAGEITPDEMQTIKAVIRWLQTRISEATK